MFSTLPTVHVSVFQYRHSKAICREYIHSFQIDLGGASTYKNRQFFFYLCPEVMCIYLKKCEFCRDYLHVHHTRVTVQIKKYIEEQRTSICSLKVLPNGWAKKYNTSMAKY